MEAKLYTALISIALVIISLALIKRGWSARASHQQELGELVDVPARFDTEEPLAAYPGVYVCTTFAGEPLTRIAVETLGEKARSILFIYSDSIVFSRIGARDLWISADQISQIHTESGMIGKFVEKNGLVVVRWQFNGTEVDTGFRTQYAEDKNSLLTALQALTPATA